MPRAFDLKLDLPADDTFKERARYSSPINFDISALDARDTGLSTVACLTPLPVSPNSPGNERDRQRSFFANYRASRSASRLQDTATLSPTLSPMEGSRDGRSSGKAKSTLYPYRKAPGSTPELSLVAGKGVEGVTQSLADRTCRVCIEEPPFWSAKANLSQWGYRRKSIWNQSSKLLLHLRPCRTGMTTTCHPLPQRNLAKRTRSVYHKCCPGPGRFEVRTKSYPPRRKQKHQRRERHTLHRRAASRQLQTLLYHALPPTEIVLSAML